MAEAKKAEFKFDEASRGTPRFAVGVLKGRPLSYSGMTYQFIRHNGETVALFSNGAMAKFYMGPLEPEQPDKASCTFETKRDSVPCASPPPFEEIISEIKLEFESADEQKQEEPGPRTIAAYRTRKGGRPLHPCDPVYCVRQNRTKANFERELVGTGLREYLWLYAKLREFGRGRLAAISEALDIYFL